MTLFKDRADAGRRLAARLLPLKDRPVTIVALPRGGVPVAAPVARALSALLDVFLVRKIGAPDNPEFGLGAVTENGTYWIDHRSASMLGVSPEEIERSIMHEAAEARRRAELYRGGRPLAPVEGRSIILVDDGLATGGSARAALRALRSMRPRELILAVPVASAEGLESLRSEADEVIALETPENFFSVGQWYQSFDQLSDEDVIHELDDFNRPATRGKDISVSIPADGVTLAGDLTLPTPCLGIVIFAHGSGSSRKSPRNQSVARTLNRQGMATLLFDLLSDEEAENRENVFDVDLLSSRLVAATKFVQTRTETEGLPIGYFGASTGAAAALCAATDPGVRVSAVVSRGGRPDLALECLRQVQTPTLLLVGGADLEVLGLNREAAAHLNRCQIHVIPDATHLFEEPGALEAVADEASRWFEQYFRLAESNRLSAA